MVYNIHCKITQPLYQVIPHKLYFSYMLLGTTVKRTSWCREFGALKMDFRS